MGYNELDVQERSFPHRRNSDGSYDSICPNCYRTIGKGSIEDLKLLEQQHYCAANELSLRYTGASDDHK